MLTLLSLPILIRIVGAIIPAIYLLTRVYRLDRLEKESTGLVIKLVILGIISTACAVLTETIGFSILDNAFDQESLAYYILSNFIVVALSEEGFKFVVLKRATWKNPEFNCQFDAVVYAVSVSLGFALWENIQYVFTYGLGVAISRAFTAVPGHACFGVLMGAWYGMAKKYADKGEPAKSRRYKQLAVIMPVIAHGAYDFFATISGYIGSLAFIIVIVILFWFCNKLITVLSENDNYIESSGEL